MHTWNAEHPRENPSERIIGIDGEGQGRKPHVYNFLAAADERGKVWTVGDDPRKQLTTEECLEFILELPVRSLIFAYAFLYDLTKILRQLDDRALYLLFHEQRRMFWTGKAIIYRPVTWGPYKLNYMQRRFTVRRGNRRATVWDVFTFFQSKFTKALSDWKVAPPHVIAEMERMKERRSTFDALQFEEIKNYCQSECKYLATLGRELITAHTNAGIELKRYHGAGSTAVALMDKHNVKVHLGEIPDAMREAVACAFFGGRFENSVIGAIRRPVWNADINSAYPYAATFLPCLTCGHWRFSERVKESELEAAQLALVNWHLPQFKGESEGESWGVLPVRKLDGSIAWPLGASGGWTWRSEFLAARRLRPDVHATGAWLYTSNCTHTPFSFLPAVYLERLRLGSDSRGIVLKLGPNSVYGKLVQSVGFKPPYQNWVWGGNIPSETRAQLLDAIRLAPNRASVLMLATDGVWSDAPIDLPAPRDTGTNGTGKPLGGWTVKEYPRGVFAARPGIYFPLDPTEEDLQKVRARGLGRKVLYEAHRKLEAAFAANEGKVLIEGGQRFIGAKTGLSWYPKQGVKRSKNYGEWIDWATEVSFDPKPKRERVLDGGRLKCWDYFEAPSLPYDNAIKNDEDLIMQLATMIADEQPSGDFVEE